jgi:hypothetical protein
MSNHPVSNFKYTGLVLLLSIAFVAGIYLIGYSTVIGPWAYSDSTSYITAARNLASGYGISYPDSNGTYLLLTWHPPLFPILLSLPVWLGADALQSARWLNASLFGILAALSIWIVWRFSQSLLLSLGTGLLFLLSATFLRIYSGAMSEGFFLVSGFAGLYLLVEYLISPAKRFLLILASILIGFAYLTRYTGVAFISTGAIVVLFLFNGRWNKRLANLILYFLGAGFPPLVWTEIVYLQTGTFGGRTTGTPVPIAVGIKEYFQTFWITLQGWIPFINRGNQYISALMKLVIIAVFFIGAIIVLTLLARRKNKSALLRPIAIWGIVLAIFIINYITFHLASFLFTQARPDVDRRLLSPILVSVYLAVPLLFGGYTQTIKPAWAFSSIFLVLSFVSVWYFHQEVRVFLFEMRHYGEGYTSLRWKEEPAFNKIKILDTQFTLFCNDPALLMLYTNRVSKVVDVRSVKNGLLEAPEKPAYLIMFFPQAESQLGVSIQPWLEDQPSQFVPILIDSAAGIYQWEAHFK